MNRFLEGLRAKGNGINSEAQRNGLCRSLLHRVQPKTELCANTNESQPAMGRQRSRLTGYDGGALELDIIRYLALFTGRNDQKKGFPPFITVLHLPTNNNRKA